MSNHERRKLMRNRVMMPDDFTRLFLLQYELCHTSVPLHHLWNCNWWSPMKLDKTNCGAVDTARNFKPTNELGFCIGLIFKIIPTWHIWTTWGYKQYGVLQGILNSLVMFVSFRDWFRFTFIAESQQFYSVNILGPAVLSCEANRPKKNNQHKVPRGLVWIHCALARPLCTRACGLMRLYKGRHQRSGKEWRIVSIEST
jgi:hypothetical protein